MQTPSGLQQLIEALRCLPGVGPRSAQRMAYHLLQMDRQGAVRLTHALSHALAEIHHCQRCNTFCEDTLCSICEDTSRDARLVCVVEMPADILMVEQTRAYSGYYFVLMGRLSPLDGKGPDSLPFERLIHCVMNPAVEEIILATNFTVEGEATAHYLSQRLAVQRKKISRIARGLPVGGELEYVDAGTLAQAVLERKIL